MAAGRRSYGCTGSWSATRPDLADSGPRHTVRFKITNFSDEAKKVLANLWSGKTFTKETHAGGRQQPLWESSDKVKTTINN